METVALTPFRIFFIIVVIVSLVAVFRTFVWSTPPNKRSDRVLLFLRESIGSICVGMVVIYQWNAFTGWRLPITLVSFAVALGVVSDLRTLLLKLKIKDNQINL